MSVRPAKIQFNGGELSPWLRGRIDLEKYDKTAKLCRNFIPLAEGGMKRRGGTHFERVAEEEEPVVLRIKTVPGNTNVTLNGKRTRELEMTIGDVVTYEISAFGYVSCVGSKMVTGNTELWFYLTSQEEMCLVRIIPVQANANVVLCGEVQTEARVAKNSIITYSVSLEGYETRSEMVRVFGDMDIEVDLSKAVQSVFGDWGKPVEFVCCSAVGYKKGHLNCFYIRFTKGYLAVVFSSDDEAPKGEIDESLFLKTTYPDFNSVAYVDGVYSHTKLYERKGALIWDDEMGNRVWAYDPLSLSTIGWQIENGKYASVYQSYTGKVENNAIYVYHNGQEVWSLKGRKNG